MRLLSSNELFMSSTLPKRNFIDKNAFMNLQFEDFIAACIIIKDMIIGNLEDEDGGEFLANLLEASSNMENELFILKKKLKGWKAK
jgi:hypothetical protein